VAGENRDTSKKEWIVQTRIVAAVALLFVTSVTAQQRSPAKKQHSSVKATAEAKTEMLPLPDGIDPAASRLPVAWVQDKFQALYSNLTITPKDQFETKERFQERASRVFGGKFFALRIDPDRIGQVYDSEDQRFTFSMRPYDSPFGAPMGEGLNAISDRILIAHGAEPARPGEYLGPIALGFPDKGLRTGFKEEDVLLVRPALALIRFAVAVPREKARSFHPFFLLVFQPEAYEKDGFILAASESCGPDDKSKHVSSRIIFAGEAEIWAVNEETGEVLSKLIVGRGRPWMPPDSVVAVEDHQLLSPDSGLRVATIWSQQPVEVVADFYMRVLKGRGFEPKLTPTAAEKVFVTARDTRVTIDRINEKTVVAVQRGSSEPRRGFLP
jgi:hypothetical protein